MAHSRRPSSPRPARVRPRTPATLESLADALYELSSHRDDDVATAAASILTEVRTLDASPTAQRFQGIHARVFAARLGAPTGLSRDWRAAHGISRAVLVRLVRTLKAEALSKARASSPLPQ